MKYEVIIKTQTDWEKLDRTVRDRIVVNPAPFKVVVDGGLKRTIDQNKLLHAVFEDCARKTRIQIIDRVNNLQGFVTKSADWWKNELKCKLGKKEVHFDLEEQPTIIVVSTTEYNTREMAEFCEKIVAHMKTEYGVDIELPDELNNKPKDTK